MSYHRLLSKYLEKEFNLFKKNVFYSYLLFRTKKSFLVAWRHRHPDYAPLLFQTRFIYTIYSLFLASSYSYTGPWSMFINTTIFYFILYNVLFIYQTRFIYFLSLTPSYSYIRPGLYILISL